MFRSYTMGRFSGIDIKVHSSLLLLLGFFVLSGLVSSGLAGALDVLILAALVVTSVTLHELGHIFAARAFGIGTAGLTLYPFGGIARLTRDASRGLEEVVVAAAGPAVNIVLGGLAMLGMAIMGEVDLGGFLGTALVINIAMALFNLVPAYPMDGGRIFRGILWPYLGKAKATDWAARAGQGFAVLFGLIGIATGHLMLLVIAVFIYFQATVERRRYRFAPMAHPYLKPDPELRQGQNVTRFYEDEGPHADLRPGEATAKPRSVLVKTPWGLMRVWQS